MDDEKREDESIVLGGVVSGRIYSISTVNELIQEIMIDAENTILELSKKTK